VGWLLFLAFGLDSIQVDRLVAGLSGRLVLGGVSAGFPAASLTAVVGANGVGKTTLLRAMLGAVGLRSGRVVLGGRGLETYGARERACVLAYVPQRAEGAFGFSVREVVGMGRYSRGSDAKEDVDSALRQVSLMDRADEAFGTLSAGQQQRAVLARALAQLGASEGCDLSGKVLLADEPVASMDAGFALSTLSLLGELARRGLCVVCVMHDLNLVLRTATRALALGEGEGGMGSVVVGEGEVREVVTAERMAALFGARFEMVGEAGVQALVATGAAGDGAVVGRVGSGHV
jgi:ABC-type cobalamin/Fe3+-siderophores transport system ATPase subunit